MQVTPNTKKFTYKGTQDALVNEVTVSTYKNEDTEVTFTLSNSSESEVAIRLLEDNNLNARLHNSEILLNTKVNSPKLSIAINALLLPDFASEVCQNYPLYVGTRDISKSHAFGSIFSSLTEERQSGYSMNYNFPFSTSSVKSSS